MDQNAKRKRKLTPVEIEHTIEQVAASFRFEDLIISEEDKENARRILRGEISCDKRVRQIVAKHGYDKKSENT